MLYRWNVALLLRVAGEERRTVDVGPQASESLCRIAWSATEHRPNEAPPTAAAATAAHQTHIAHKQTLPRPPPLFSKEQGQGEQLSSKWIDSSR